MARDFRLLPRDDLKGGFNVGHGYEIVSEFASRCPNSFSGEVVQWKHFRAVARISFVMEVLPWKHFLTSPWHEFLS